MDQFMQQCERYTLPPDYQSSYRKNYSCEAVLIKLVNDILWCMENKEILTLVTIDLSAAFDKVDHNLLLEVLEHQFGAIEKSLIG